MPVDLLVSCHGIGRALEMLGCSGLPHIRAGACRRGVNITVQNASQPQAPRRTLQDPAGIFPSAISFVESNLKTL